MLSAVAALKELRRVYADDLVLRGNIGDLTKAAVRVARRFCMVTGRKPAEFDRRLGMQSFVED